MLCPKCKKEVQNDSIYCNYCGKKLVSTPKPKALKRPNGLGTIGKMSGRRRKPYYVRKTVNGQRMILGWFETQTEAVKHLEKLNNKSISQVYNYTVQEMFDMLIDLNKDKLTKSGMTNYISGYNYLEPYKNVKMREIRTVHFQEAINRAAESGVGFATWKKIQNVASLMCQLAMANDLIDKNYAQLVTMPKYEKKDEKPSFSQGQLGVMWQLWEKDDGIAAILAMCYIGVRINEFLDLKKSEVDMAHRVIHSKGSKTEAGKNRILALPDVIVPVFEKFMQTPGEWLFPSPTGKRWEVKNFRDRLFYRTLEKYNLHICEHDPELKITPHSCRHTYAYLCVKHGVDQKATMDLMGHSKYSTSAEIYAEATRFDVDFLRSEANKITK